MKMKTALTIAGSDSGGGAGIQADIKTMMANGVYAMSAITALTAQNTTKVADIMEVTPQFLAEQLDCIFTDIRPDAVRPAWLLRSSDPDDRRETDGVSGGKYRGRSGHGFYKRSKTDQ